MATLLEAENFEEFKSKFYDDTVNVVKTKFLFSNEERDKSDDDEYFPEISDEDSTQSENENDNSTESEFRPNSDDVDQSPERDQLVIDDIDENRTGQKRKSKAKHKRPKDRLYYRDGDYFKCRQCDFETKNYPAMRYHWTYAHRGPEAKKWRCKICEKEYSSASSLQTHTKIHDDKKYSCDRCSMKFRLKHHLKRHLLAQHHDVSTKIIQCEFCDKKVSTQQSYNRHLKAIHPDKSELTKQRQRLKEPSQCECCGKIFSSSSSLKVHLMKKTDLIHADYRAKIAGDETKTHACYLCDKRFKTGSELRYHLSRHAGSKFICDQCGGTYPTASELRKHHRKSKCARKATDSKISGNDDNESKDNPGKETESCDASKDNPQLL